VGLRAGPARLAAGTTEELVFGELESAVRGFHAEIDRALEAPAAG
jgi:hypothetical protein